MTKLKTSGIIFLLFLTLMMSGQGMDIGLGAATQWASHNYDALLILPQSYPPRQNLAALIEANHDNFAFQAGRVMGATAAILQGITELVNGIQRVQVGVLVSAETGGIGGAVAVSGVVESVHGAVVAVHGARGLVESTGHILKMASKGGGGGSHVKIVFKDDKALRDALGVKDIHPIKKSILIQSKNLLKQLGAKNPNIYGVDNEGYIILQHPTQKDKFITTDLLFDTFKEE